jgi:hypothetical protein
VIPMSTILRAFRHRSASHYLTAVAMQAARHVDGYHVQRLGVHTVDQVAGKTADRPAEAGPEQGVDHQRTGVEQPKAQCFHRPLPALRGPGSVAAQRAAITEESHPNRPAGGMEVACRHEAIATIVPRATQDDDRTRQMALEHGVCHRPTSRFHEIAPGRAAADGGGIRHRHLGAAQEDQSIGGCQVSRKHPSGLDGGAIGAADRN